MWRKKRKPDEPKAWYVESEVEEIIEKLIEDIPNDAVASCICPKGGKYERENGSYYDCEKCGGSEYIGVQQQLRDKWLNN